MKFENDLETSTYKFTTREHLFTTLRSKDYFFLKTLEIISKDYILKVKTDKMPEDSDQSDDEDEQCDEDEPEYDSDEDEEYTVKKKRNKPVAPKNIKTKKSKNVVDGICSVDEIRSVAEIEKEIKESESMRKPRNDDDVQMIDINFLKMDVEGDQGRSDDLALEMLKEGDLNKLDDILNIPTNSPLDMPVEKLIPFIVGKDKDVYEQATVYLTFLAKAVLDLTITEEFIYVKNFIRGIIFHSN